jgi:hypothetical protein
MQSCVFSISAIPGGHLSARHFVAVAGYFLLHAQKKVPKENGALVCTGYAGSLRGSEKSAFA